MQMQPRPLLVLEGEQLSLTVLHTFGLSFLVLLSKGHFQVQEVECLIIADTGCLV